MSTNTTNPNGRRLDCEAAREAVHVLLDGDLLEAGRRQALDEHLAGCPACREFEAESRWLQGALRSLAVPAMPDTALEQVWNATTREASPAKVIRPARGRFEWRALAAAAALAFVLYGAWDLGRVRPSTPSPEEVARATEQMRMVLGVTANALHEARTVAVDEVLAGEVSPAIRKIPIRFPGEARARQKESRNGA
jgi:predicted anti-sigma-YlaC factor YlaD